MKLFASPIATPEGVVFYCTKGEPKLFKEPHQSKRVSEEEARRIIALMDAGTCGFAVVTQRFSDHLLEGHEIILLNDIRPAYEDEKDAKLKLLPERLASAYGFVEDLANTLQGIEA